MLLYAITSRLLLAETEPEPQDRLVALAATWAATGVDYIQIREKDLTPADLIQLASRIVQATRPGSSHTKVLINGEPKAATTIALQSQAAGVHLPGGLTPSQLAAAVTQVQEIWQATQPAADQPPVLSVSCHSVAEIRAARAAGATLALFAPVFEKVLPDAQRLPGQGLKSLAQACQAAREASPHPELPVLALGGVTLGNTNQCLAAGAAGIAAIRLFLNAPYAKNRGEI